MSDEKNSIYSIRRALAVYFETEPKIRKLKSPEEIEKILDPGEYGKYIGALYLLRNLEVSGDDIIEILSNGDDSFLRYKSLVRILLSPNNLRIGKEDIWK